MEDVFPDYLRQYILDAKSSKNKSKGQVVCSCGCEELDYNYLFFKFVPSEEDKKMAELVKQNLEMRKQLKGPYKKYNQEDSIPFSEFTCGTFDGKSYWIYYVGGPTKHHKTLDEVMKDPNYIGHCELIEKDANEPTEYEYVYAKCKYCGKEILLFDDRYYGYDGVCTHYEQPNKLYRTDGKLKTTKPHCEGSGYKIYVTIDSTGKEDLLEDTDETITEENWKDAFEWIKIDLECSKCGKKRNVLNLETM